MTDRELLELAGKAAGVDYRPQYDLVKTSIGWGTWNPITDDGDALRLAVKLGLVVDCSRPSAGEPFKAQHFSQEDFADPEAATRRAIVRAAAEIGKGMQ